MRADLAAPPVTAPDNIATRLGFYRWRRAFKEDGQEYWIVPAQYANAGEYMRWGEAYAMLVMEEGP